MYEIYERLLKLKGVTTADVCRETGLKQSTIANWKRRGGGCSKNTAVALARYFNVSIDYLMNGNEDFNINKVKEIAKRSLIKAVEKTDDDESIIIEGIKREFPYLLDEELVEYMERIWKLPLKHREAVFDMIELQENKYKKEKGATSSESNKAG